MIKLKSYFSGSILSKMTLISILFFFHMTSFAQTSNSIEEYYFDTGHYIIDLDYVQGKGSNKKIFHTPYNGAIEYRDQNTLLGFTIDPQWNRIIYGDYGDWLKWFGQEGSGSGEFNHPRAIVSEGDYGWIFVADTYNGRIVRLKFDNINNVIDPNEFTLYGSGVLNRPIDLDYDDAGDGYAGNDILWIVDSGLNQIVSYNHYPTAYKRESITSLYNPSSGTLYSDLSGLNGVAIRKNGLANWVNSNVGEKLYLIDWKLRKLFFVDANSISNGLATIISEITYSSGVQLSGVESDFFGDVWVVDIANGELLKYTWDLEYLDELSGLSRPTSVAGVRRHQLNMAITERWTETTGQRTYSQGADIKNLSVSGGQDIANVSLKLTNYSKLVVKMYKGSTLEATLVDNIADGFINASGTQSLNWLKEIPVWGNYTAKVWAYSYDDNAVYHYDSYNFSFALESFANGPSSLGFKQQGTFTAQTTGGSSAPTYQWYKKYDGSTTWYTLGTSQSQTEMMVYTGFTMKVDVTSGNETSTATTYCSSGSGGGGNPKILMLPKSYSLLQNHPNPFNPITTIKYELPEPSIVSIVIYNLLGHEMIRWAKGYEQAGYKDFTWNGKNKLGQNVPTGMYIYKLSATSLESNKVFTENRKMVLLK